MKREELLEYLRLAFGYEDDSEKFNQAYHQIATFIQDSILPERRLLCPKCGEEGKRMTGSSVPTSVPPFYKNSKLHSGSVQVERCKCSNGHHWSEIVPENAYK